MTRKIITGLLAIILCLPNLVAQTTITEDVIQELKMHYLTIMDTYKFHVEFIADKKNSNQVKDEHINAALAYFIGKGDGLKLLDENGNPVMEDGAYKFIIEPPRIEITSRRIPTKRQYIKAYLRNLKNWPYEEVSISSSQAYFIQDLKQIDENEYEAVLAYCQIFKGRTGEWEIIDIDEKRATMRITKEEYADGKVRWKVEIGNIYAQSIEHK